MATDLSPLSDSEYRVIQAKENILFAAISYQSGFSNCNIFFQNHMIYTMFDNDSHVAFIKKLFLNNNHLFDRVSSVKNYLK